MKAAIIVLCSACLGLLTAVPSFAQDGINVRQLALYDMPGQPLGVAVSGNYAYVADGEDDGLRVIDISNPSSPFEAGFYVTPGAAFDVAVSGNYAYVADHFSGLRVVDITNPSSPFEVGFYDTPGQALGVAVSGNYAYVADVGRGLRVVNIANPAAPFEVGFYDTPGAAFDVAVSGNYAYVADLNCGLRVVNIANPSSPTEVGFWDTPRNAWSVAVAGNYAYVADFDRGLWIVNITNPATSYEAGCALGGGARGVAVSGNYAYVANRYYGLRVVDITNPSAPCEVGLWCFPGQANGVAVAGSTAYVAVGFRGLGICDCSPAMGAACIISDTVTLIPDNPNFPGSQDFSACAHLAPGVVTQIVVPVGGGSDVPAITVTAGCTTEPDCPPADGWHLILPWTFDPPSRSFCTIIYLVGSGSCVTLHLDEILPVELLSFTAVPGDAQVSLRWQTASETGSDRFEIERNGAIVHHAPAAGDATGHSYSWTDRAVTNGQTYHYALWSVEVNGDRNLLRETDATPRAGIVTVTEYALHGNYPNPFNPVTEIAFDLPEAGTVTLKVFDLMGREVAVLVNGERPAGQHTIRFDARDLPSGMYICRMTANEFTASHKMMLIR